MRNLDDSFSNKYPYFQNNSTRSQRTLRDPLAWIYIFSPNAVAVFLSRREVLRVVMTIVIGNKHDQAAANGSIAAPPFSLKRPLLLLLSLQHLSHT